MYPQDPSYPPSPYAPSPHMDPMNPMSPYMQQYPPSPMMPMHGGMQSSYGFMPSPAYHPNMPSPGYPPGMYNSFYGMPHTASTYNSPNQPFMNPPPAVALAVPERGASTRTGQQAVRRSSNSTVRLIVYHHEYFSYNIDREQALLQQVQTITLLSHLLIEMIQLNNHLLVERN